MTTSTDDPSTEECQNEWVQKLQSAEYGQAHLVEGKNCPNGLKKLVTGVQLADQTYPGGLLNYIQRARKLLAESCDGVNPFDGYTPEVPLGVDLKTGSAEFMNFEKIGLGELNKMAFVLVAGGLGERLGYPGIKVALPTNIINDCSYLEYYIKMILSCEDQAEKTTGSRPKLPLAIMTSEDTHAKTVQFLAENNSFGFPEDQLTIMKQEKVPALVDNEARIALKSDDEYAIETKPHGHGDVHTLLKQHELPTRWIKEGREYVLFFQDTNPLVSHALCPMLGVSKKLGLTMNTLTVPRKPGEAVGAICKLNKNNGESLTINVEYNQLSALLGEDVADPATGNSKYPGNTNILLFDLPRYSEILEKTGGTIPEFVNPKYKDSTKTQFKSPTRLECMMQEYPRLFDSEDKVGSTQLDRWLCFSAVKNNIVDAAGKVGVPAESAYTGESDFYHANAQLLEIAAKKKCNNVDIAPAVETEFFNVKHKLGPKVVIDPSFGISLTQIEDRLLGGDIKISQKSTLILDGDVTIDGLTLDGGLSLKGSPGKTLTVQNLNVANQAPEFVELPKDNKEADSIKIRGYNVRKNDIRSLSSLIN